MKPAQNLQRSKKSPLGSGETTQTSAQVRASGQTSKPVHSENVPTADTLQDGASLISAEARRALIEQAAYFRAERRGFEAGHEIEDWVAAELEINEFIRGSGCPGDSRQA